MKSHYKDMLLVPN